MILSRNPIILISNDFLLLPASSWKLFHSPRNLSMTLQAGKVRIGGTGTLWKTRKVESCALNISPNGIIWRHHKLGIACMPLSIEVNFEHGHGCLDRKLYFYDAHDNLCNYASGVCVEQ